MSQPQQIPVRRVPLAKRVNASQEDGPELVTETIWHNPTDKPVRLELYVGVDQTINRVKMLGRRLKHEEKTGLHVYEIPPGGTASLPIMFDRAIQDVRNGVIQGGLGPQLRKEGSQAVLNPALDDALARMKAGVEAAAEAMLKEKVHAQAMLMAQAEAEKAKAEIEARSADPKPNKK